MADRHIRDRPDRSSYDRGVAAPELPVVTIGEAAYPHDNVSIDTYRWEDTDQRESPLSPELGHHLGMAEPEEILVELLDEGVRVWAPVEAQKLPDGLYVLPDSSPDDQRWAIAPGSIVRCERLPMGLVAVEAVRPPS